MLAARAALWAVVAAGLLLAWTYRHAVTTAYSQPSSPESAVGIKLSGVDLTVEPSPVSPTPYAFEPAPDTRHEPVEVVFDPEPVELELASPEGTATLSGAVLGPDEPVPLATVRLERHTAAGMTSYDVIADEAGQWLAEDLLGGRYRVRAWLTGEHSTGGSEVFFLNEGETRTVDLPVEPVDEHVQMASTDGGDIYEGLTGTVAVAVTSETVDADGYLVVSGVPGAVVSLATSAGATLESSTVTAGVDGVARFLVRCERPGPVTAVARHDETDTDVWLQLPRCVPAPSQTAPTSEMVPGSGPDPTPEAGER